MRFHIYDHFGLDQEDVEKKYSADPSFVSWFILQHYDLYQGKYKPFITVIDIDVPFEGKLK